MAERAAIRSEKKQYWPTVSPILGRQDTILLEARASLALIFAESMAKVSVFTATPEEIAKRCFALADAFITEAESRKEIRSTVEELERLEEEKKQRTKKAEETVKSTDNV